MKICVTGGAGFIGSALVKRLVSEGHWVNVLDNCFRGSREVVPRVGVTFYEGDVRDFSAVHSAVAGCDEVIHLAYINGTRLFYEMPDQVMEVAVKGMLNVLEACRLDGIKKMMLASSSEVCRANIGDMDEDIPLVIPDPFNPRYSYSAGKIMSEMMAIHSGLFDWLTILRPFNVYGEHMSEGHVIPDFKKQLDETIANHAGAYHFLPTIPFEILGSGNETRSFCYIDDFIDGLMIARNRVQQPRSTEIFNIGTPEETTIRNLARCMAEIRGVRLSITEGNKLREGSIPRRKPDIAKLQVLGYQPKVSLNEGLRRVLCQ